MKIFYIINSYFHVRSQINIKQTHLENVKDGVLFLVDIMIEY
jgi:hypothetical protein